MSQFEQVQAAAGAAFDAVNAEIRSKMKELGEQNGMRESFDAFTAAVDWREPWIVGTISAQALLLLAVIVFRRHQRVTFTIFIMSVGLVLGAERLNGLGARHWQQFAGQNYFDGGGIFISVLLSAPLVLTMFVILIIYLIHASKLLVKMKRKELQYKARQRARTEKGSLTEEENKKAK